MYVNNAIFTENHNCKDCANTTICKWCDKMKEVHNELSNIKTDLSPIRVSIKCNSLTRKQNAGFIPGQRDY